MNHETRGQRHNARRELGLLRAARGHTYSAAILLQESGPSEVWVRATNLIADMDEEIERRIEQGHDRIESHPGASHDQVAHEVIRGPSMNTELLKEALLEACRVFSGPIPEDETDDPARRFWDLAQALGIDSNNLPPRKIIESVDTHNAPAKPPGQKGE